MKKIIQDKKINTNYTSILESCISIANNRQSCYGEATANIKFATELIDSMFGLKLSVKDVCKVLVGLKMAREKFNHKEDNILDIINYFAIMQYSTQNELHRTI